MADDVTITPVAATPPAPPQVPEDYEELKVIRDRYNALAETINPYLDDIRPIIEDEDQRAFWRSARETYEERKRKAEPQIGEEFQPLVKHFEDKFAPVVEWATTQQKRDQDAAAAKKADEDATTAAAQAANLEYAKRLAAERPDLAEDDYAGIGMLAAYAAHRSISLEEAWNRKGNTLSAPPKKEKPPTSLRGDTAAPGVPGESTEPPIRSTGDLRKRLAANLRAGGMKG